jgi:hypothetical protein
MVELFEINSEGLARAPHLIHIKLNSFKPSEKRDFYLTHYTMKGIYQPQHRKIYNAQVPLEKIRPVIALRLRGDDVDAYMDPSFLIYPKGEEAHERAMEKLHEFSANDVDAAIISTRRLSALNTQIFNQCLADTDEENILHVNLMLKEAAALDSDLLEAQIATHDLSDYGVTGMRVYFPELKVIRYGHGFLTQDITLIPIDEAMAEHYTQAIATFNRRCNTPFTGLAAGNPQVGSSFLPSLRFVKKEHLCH